MKKDIWFRNKIWGYGWTPCNWKGWLVLVSYIILNIDAALILLPVYRYSETRELTSDHYIFFSFVAISTIILLAICFVKGEKLKWRWGR